MDASVAAPYTAGSRVPSRFRFGPFSNNRRATGVVGPRSIERVLAPGSEPDAKWARMYLNLRQLEYFACAIGDVCLFGSGKSRLSALLGAGYARLRRCSAAPRR